MSSVDVFDIKLKIAMDTPFTKLHLDYERLDYPLYDAQSDTYIMERCDKLCSGDYLTSFCSTVFQIATYQAIKEMFTIDDYLCGGDDAALLISAIN